MYSCCDFIVFYRIIWILEVVWMKYKILVVDDDKELVKMLCSYFNMKQYETITATDGMEALNKIKMKDSAQYRSENSRKNQLVLLESPILKTFSNTA